MFESISVLSIIILFFLIVASYLDFRYRAVPSVLLTGLIFIALVNNPSGLYLGTVSFVFAWLLRDFFEDAGEIPFGVADIKIMALMGILLVSLQDFLIMIVVLMVFQFIYTLIYQNLKSESDENGIEMPFIPCLTAVYIVMLLVGGFV